MLYDISIFHEKITDISLYGFNCNQDFNKNTMIIYYVLLIVVNLFIS